MFEDSGIRTGQGCRTAWGCQIQTANGFGWYRKLDSDFAGCCRHHIMYIINHYAFLIRFILIKSN